MCGVRMPDNHKRLLFDFIAVDDVDCPVCGYNLRGLGTDICPECGRVFELRLGSPQLSFGLFVWLLAPLIMASGLTIIIIALMAATGSLPSRREWGIYAIAVLGLLTAVVAPMIYSVRTSFFRARRALQLLLIVLVWVTIISAVSAFLVAGV